MVLVYPYGIVVDQNGDRFFDEGAGLVQETWEHFARHIHMALPGHQAYAILDSRLLDIPNYERAIRSEVAPIRANTVAELAAQFGVPADRLQATVNAYNTAATGETSPFDATRTDGIATNPNAEVLGAYGPIPGLFAAGEITGHFHGTAPNAVAMLRAIVFGRVAGKQSVLDC